MIKKIDFRPILNIVLLILFFGPLFYISRFIFLSTDDFCMAIKAYENFGGNFWEWYNYINGRYINAVFALMPVYNLSVYRIIIITLILLLGGALFWFVQKLFYCYELQANFHKKLLLVILLYLVLIAQLPSLFEIFYWYSAAGPYLLSFIFLLLFLGAALTYFFKRKMNFLFFALVIILINGNNEILILLTNFILMLLFLGDWIKRRELNNRLLVLNIISWLSSLAVILSPGTVSRRGLHDYGGDFIGSVKVSFFYGAKFIILNLTQIPYLIFFLIVFLWIYNTVKDTEKRFIFPLYLLTISYLSVTSVFFIVYYATGLFDVYVGRIGNMAGMLVFIFAFLNVFNFAVYLRSKSNYRILRSSYYSPVLISVLLVFLIFKNENYVNIRKDITEGNLVIYKDEMEKRFRLLAESNEKTIILEPIEGTRILKSGDKYYVGQEWLQYWYTEYINIYLGKNFERININIQK